MNKKITVFHGKNRDGNKLKDHFRFVEYISLKEYEAKPKLQIFTLKLFLFKSSFGAVVYNMLSMIQHA